MHVEWVMQPQRLSVPQPVAGSKRSAWCDARCLYAHTLHNRLHSTCMQCTKTIFWLLMAMCNEIHVQPCKHKPRWHAHQTFK